MTPMAPVQPAPPAPPAQGGIVADPPSFLVWTDIVPFVIFLIVVAAIVVLVPMMFGARKYDIAKQANVVGSLSIPAVALIVFLTGLAFVVINYFAGWFSVSL